MYLEISNPMDYHAGLYIRLSKEDESEGDVYKRQLQDRGHELRLHLP